MPKADCFDKEPMRYAFRTVKGLLVLPCREIILFRFRDSAWQAMQADRTVHTLCTHISADQLLDIGTTFLQIRRDCIINADYLTFIENNSLRCVLSSPYRDIELFASRRYYAHIQQQLRVI